MIVNAINTIRYSKFILISNALVLPSVNSIHKTMEEAAGKDESEQWVVGKVPVLRFSCTVIPTVNSGLPAEKLHMTYKTCQAETKLLNTLLTSHGLREVPFENIDFNLLWTGLHVKPQVLRNLLPHQRVNHFPRSYELTRKDRLYKNIEQMQHSKGLKHFDFIPQTFVLPAEISELTASHYRHRGAWIVKPIASSRGRGIYIVNSIEEIPLQETVVVAKYIDNPLLVNGCKCDLRLYVLVTSYNPLVVYLYEEGLVRLATVKYDYKQNNLWNPCMHLCNYSINKHHSDYIKSSDPNADDVGHKWSLSALLKHLKSENLDTALLMRHIEDMVIKAILATVPSVVTACRLFVPHFDNCFELYGFDILIDADLKPWLLEVNLSPSLGCDSPLDTRLKSAMLSDLLTLIGIPAVDPVTRPKLSEAKKRGKSASRYGIASNALSSRPNHRVSRAISQEEAKIIRAVREQFNRKRGFVRIFPTSETWKKYSRYLDGDTGIPSFNNSPYNERILIQNYNKLIHLVMFPNSIATQRAKYTNTFPTILSSQMDRLSRYERSLSNRYRKDLELDTSSDEGEGSCDKRLIATNDVMKYLQTGFRLSENQIQAAFYTYLQRILRHLNDAESNYKVDREVQCDIILKFLHTISHILSMPLMFKKPSENLKGNDKAAITAKHLSDFLFFYVQEIKDEDSAELVNNVIPNRPFHCFLKSADEKDIEKVLQVCVQKKNGDKSSKSRISKLHLYHVYKRSENSIMSKVTNAVQS